jgi:hypothetical protein
VHNVNKANVLGANSVPRIFQTLSPLLLKSMNLNFRITHSSKTKSKQVKVTTIKELIFFCIFDKKMQAKVKQSKTKIK